MQEPLSEIAPDSRTDDELTLSKLIIIPWEEITQNKLRTSIGYEKYVTFHNLDYIQPIQFQSVRLLQESLQSPSPVQEQILKCQHCQRVGYIEYQCFNLHH
jgi:hypothetical protein